VAARIKNGRRFGAAFVAAMMLSTSARAETFSIAWDHELAFDFDRGQYEQSLQQIVSQGYAAASSFLGIARQGSLQITIYTPEHYEKVFGSDAERMRGAHYSRDAIHVNGGNRLNSQFASEIAHEMTHAVLDYQGTAHRLPAWFNEGLAERVAWIQRGLDVLATHQADELKRSVAQDARAPLQLKGPLRPFGYLESYAAVLLLEQRAGRRGLLSIATKTLGGEPFESALRKETHWSMNELERELTIWIERLD
jgi:hypothetical protein